MPPQTPEETFQNPLLLGWVKEWLDQAKERNSNGITVYKKAYNSLKACPITFTHPEQLKQLKGFGDTLCRRLTEKLKEHCEENGLPMPKKTKLKLPGQVDEDNNDDSPARPAEKPPKAKPYVPGYRTGAYALILGLYEQEVAGGLTKDELIEKAQPHCRSSFTASEPGQFYTAWNSMKTVQNKDLVYEQGRPTRRYFLTDEGYEVARRIEQAKNAGPSRASNNARQRSEDLGFHSIPLERSASPEVESQPRQQPEYADVVPDSRGKSNSSVTFRPGRLMPGQFTVQLVLDNREIRSRTDRDYMQDELRKKGIVPIVRSLGLGDALWVAKCHDSALLKSKGSEGDEVVLDYIVERKRLDDLISSVKDGRFREQKFRMRRSGVKNVIYIVEEMRLDHSNVDKYEETIRSAIASTQVVNGYFLKRTQKMDDTIRYLARMTFLLKKQYENKPLLVIPTEVLDGRTYISLVEDLRQKQPFTNHYISYQAFASLASKTEMMTLRDVYLKMLMCTKQVTGEKAIEIQKKWKTPYELIKAFENCGSGEVGKKRKQELAFGEMGNLYGRKKITKGVSQRIAEVWGDVEPPK